MPATSAMSAGERGRWLVPGNLHPAPSMVDTSRLLPWEGRRIESLPECYGLDPGGIVLKAIDQEDLELLKTIANGATHFGPAQDEPSDSPTWVGQVERLRRLEREGLIRMPEPDPRDQSGYPAGVGPCQLTTAGRKALENLKA